MPNGSVKKNRTITRHCSKLIAGCDNKGRQFTEKSGKKKDKEVPLNPCYPMITIHRPMSTLKEEFTLLGN